MPASDEVEYRGDLNQMLIRNPSKTRIMIASGTSMNLAGIDDGDSMIVDCSLEARHRDIVVAIILGDGHTVKRLELGKRVTRLVPESSDPIHQVREIRPDDEWMVWGVVTGCIKRFR